LIGLTGETGATGATGPAGPAGPRSTNGQDVVAAYGTAALLLTPATPFTPLPGLSVTVNVPANSRLLISSTGGIASTSTAIGQFCPVDVAVLVDGTFTTNGAYQRVVAENTVIGDQPVRWSITTAQQLTIGAHTISVVAQGLGSGGNCNVSGNNMSTLQGELNVTIINQ
jgi:hypothetical protein